MGPVQGSCIVTPDPGGSDPGCDVTVFPISSKTRHRLPATPTPLYEAQERSAAELVDAHGAAVLMIATLVSGNSRVAHSVATRVIAAASLNHDRRGPSRLTRADLSRLTLWTCAAPTATATSGLSTVARENDQLGAAVDAVVGSVAPVGRAVLSLTMFGDHTYRDAATVMGIAPEWALDLLRSGLRAVARGHPGDRSVTSPLSDRGALELQPESRGAMAHLVSGGDRTSTSSWKVSGDEPVRSCPTWWG